MTNDKLKIKEKKAKKIKIFAMDVDGVLTNGKIFFVEGKEIKLWDVKDRLAFYTIRRLGFKTCWISGRDCVEMGKNLKIDKVFAGTLDKLRAWEEALNFFSVKPAEVLYMGDDLLDIGVLRRAGLSACPSDAVEEVKKVCDLVCRAKGGDGVFREVVEFVLKAQGLWKEVGEYYGF